MMFLLCRIGAAMGLWQHATERRPDRDRLVFSVIWHDFPHWQAVFLWLVVQAIPGVCHPVQQRGLRITGEYHQIRIVGLIPVQARRCQVAQGDGRSRRRGASGQQADQNDRAR
ncbi:hypothetical protein, partial [Veronia pacifica]